MSFLLEIQQSRASLPARLQTKKNLAYALYEKEVLFRQQLLAMNEDAIENYYQQYKSMLRKVAFDDEDLFICYIYDQPYFDQIHQRIIQKFYEDGIEAYTSGRNMFINGFRFTNIH